MWRYLGRWVFPVWAVLGLSITASPTHSESKGIAKAKGKQQVETKGKHGREAGELPYGLQLHSSRKGELPAGLQKKKDEDGSLTRGLEQGAKSLTSSGQAKKGRK
jgi:hypothetical protein